MAKERGATVEESSQIKSRSPLIYAGTRLLDGLLPPSHGQYVCVTQAQLDWGVKHSSATIQSSLTFLYSVPPTLLFSSVQLDLFFNGIEESRDQLLCFVSHLPCSHEGVMNA